MGEMKNKTEALPGDAELQPLENSLGLIPGVWAPKMATQGGVLRC